MCIFFTHVLTLGKCEKGKAGKVMIDTETCRRVSLKWD